MNLCIINGSPRKHKSNSKLLTEQFLNGFRKENTRASVSLSFLDSGEEMQKGIELFCQASHVIIIFPLYTDSMPGIVKEFFEKLPKSSESKRKKAGFIVQSGFPEAIHSTFVERYLYKLSKRMGYEYTGTVIKGGVEGIQVQPDFMTRKTFQRFRELGMHYAINGHFNPTIVAKLKGPERMNATRRFIFRVLSIMGFPNAYWNSRLKKNNAWHQRHAQPFLENKPGN